MVKLFFEIEDESKLTEFSEYLNIHYSVSYFNYENGVICIIFDEQKSYHQLLNEMLTNFSYLKFRNVGRKYFDN